MGTFAQKMAVDNLYRIGMSVKRKSDPTSCIWIMLLVMISIFIPRDLVAGWLERADGKTIIHLDIAPLPDPNNPDTHTRSEVAGVKRFKERFPEIFAQASSNAMSGEFSMPSSVIPSSRISCKDFGLLIGV